MKKLYFILTILMVTFSNAQVGINSSNNSNNNKWTFGGYAGLGGSFGNNGGTSIYLSPRVGYKITDNLESGLSGKLTWAKYKNFSSTLVGVGPFVNYYFMRSAYATANYQHYFINNKIKSIDEKTSTTESALYIGGGYMQRIGGNAYMQIGGVYNILYKKDSSVFSGAFVPNIGIVFGL